MQTAYERGAIPVAALAALLGIAERTLYKYAERGGWRRRYPGARPAARVRDAARAAALQARRAKALQAKGDASAHHATRQVRGAGGRFVARSQAGEPVTHEPVARGLKALDPAGAQIARVALRRAARRSRMASQAADAQRRRELDAAMLALLVRIARDRLRAGS